MAELLPNKANCWSFKDEGILAAAVCSVGTERGRVWVEKARVVVARVREYICRETRGYWAVGSLFCGVFQVRDRSAGEGRCWGHHVVQLSDPGRRCREKVKPLLGRR